MREPDFDDFSALLDDVAAVLPRAGQQALNATAKAMYFRVLGEYDLASVRAALDGHMRDPKRGGFFPTPSDVIAQLERLVPHSAHPSADEAWPIALAGRSEYETVVWTVQICEAFEACRPVLEAGDEVGARMAFRAAYTRLVDEARVAKVEPIWSVLLGFNQDRRHRAVAAAVKAGRVPESELLALPAPESGEPLLRLVAPVEGESQAAHTAKAKLRSIAQELRAS